MTGFFEFREVYAPRMLSCLSGSISGLFRPRVTICASATVVVGVMELRPVMSLGKED
jgi:hypothetical protein